MGHQAVIYGLDIETDTTENGLDPAWSLPSSPSPSPGRGYEEVFTGPEAELLRRPRRAPRPARARRARHLERRRLRPAVPRRPGRAPRARRSGSPAARPPITMRRAPLPGHRGAYRASWYDHGHLDAYRLYRGDVGPALRISCSLKSIARLRRPRRRSRSTAPGSTTSPTRRSTPTPPATPAWPASSPSAAGRRRPADRPGRVGRGRAGGGRRPAPGPPGPHRGTRPACAPPSPPTDPGSLSPPRGRLTPRGSQSPRPHGPGPPEPPLLRRSSCPLVPPVIPPCPSVAAPRSPSPSTTPAPNPDGRPHVVLVCFATTDHGAASGFWALPPAAGHPIDPFVGFRGPPSWTRSGWSPPAGCGRLETSPTTRRPPRRAPPWHRPPRRRLGQRARRRRLSGLIDEPRRSGPGVPTCWPGRSGRPTPPPEHSRAALVDLTWLDRIAAGLLPGPAADRSWRWLADRHPLRGGACRPRTGGPGARRVAAYDERTRGSRAPARERAPRRPPTLGPPGGSVLAPRPVVRRRLALPAGRSRHLPPAAALVPDLLACCPPQVGHSR